MLAPGLAPRRLGSAAPAPGFTLRPLRGHGLSSDLTCLDAKSGAISWRHTLGGGSLILVDDHLVVLDHTGLLHLVLAIGESFEAPLSVRVLPPEPPSFTPPSFADGQQPEGGRRASGRPGRRLICPTA